MDELAEKMMLEAYERIMEYESRDSYKKLKELTEEGRETLRRYYENYRDKAQYFQDKAEKNTDHERYATGGNIHRGVLCPGIMEALVVGNAKRGRFSKKAVASGYIYGYDKADRLIWADMAEGKIRDREHIFWEGSSVQVGVKFAGKELELEEISQATYDPQGRLSSYLYGSLYEGKVSTAVIERYRYEGNRAYVTFINSDVPDSDISALFCVGSIPQAADENKYQDIFSDYIYGEHIVLYLDDTGRVTKYTRCTDEYPDDLEEHVPKYKLTVYGQNTSDTTEWKFSSQEACQERKSCREFLKCLKTQAGRKKKLWKLADAFENMCRMPGSAEEEMLLFETGIFDFTGEPLFYFSLVRQFPNHEGEYMQLHLDVMFLPDQKNRNLCGCFWEEESEEAFFDNVRKSEAFLLLKDETAKKVRIYLEET